MTMFTKSICLTICAGLLATVSFAALGDPLDDLKKAREEARRKLEGYQKQVDDAKKTAQPGQEPPAGMKPEDQAMMDAMMKLSQPGEQHKIIQGFAGTWNAEMKFWMDPTAKEPMTATGEMKARLVHGDRFLIGDYTSTFMGQPFSGTLTWGYNTIQKRYESTWFDSFGTFMLVSQGQPTADGKTIDSTSNFSMPGMDGKMMDVTQKEKITWVNKDTFKQEMWHATKEQGEMKVMEIVYTRAAEKAPAAASPAMPGTEKTVDQIKRNVPMPVAPGSPAPK